MSIEHPAGARNRRTAYIHDNIVEYFVTPPNISIYNNNYQFKVSMCMLYDWTKRSTIQRKFNNGSRQDPI